ncbi:MAG: hypothetical protein WBO93_17540, partial [Gammaproteobacteria bacterium]
RVRRAHHESSVGWSVPVRTAHPTDSSFRGWPGLRFSRRSGYSGLKYDVELLARKKQSKLNA